MTTPSPPNMGTWRAEHDRIVSGEFTASNSLPANHPILETLCDQFLPNNVSAILYLFNSENYGRSTASVQYFFQLAGYLGIPVIAWNADNSGLERQMYRHYPKPFQAMTMTTIRLYWQYHISIPKHVLNRFTITNTVRVGDVETDLTQLVNSEARILFLYSTRSEAASILAKASVLGLTGRNYLWIVTQSVIQSQLEAPIEFPVGMLGIHFDTRDEAMIHEIKTCMYVLAYGLAGHIKDEIGRGVMPDLAPDLSCDTGDARWRAGDKFYRFLKNVSIDMQTDPPSPNLEFKSDGTRKSIELKIMNLRPDLSRKLVWEEIGVWHSAKPLGLEVKDIVWPGYSHVPPNGIPEKFHLKITFMEEPPFINMDPPHPVTGKCTANKGVPCRIASDYMMQGVNVTWAMRNSSYYRCCSGFCIDLLVKFSHDLGFSYDFFRVEDGIWGAIVNGKWTGLPGAIINGKADMIMTSIKINSQREEVLDFTVPFLDTGIAIVVAKRTGIISPTAFLEPFDTASWMLVALVAIQVAAVSIFLFEWLSPSGYNMKLAAPNNHRFSLLRTLWMVWAILFQAAVNVDCPRGYTASGGRFLVMTSEEANRSVHLYGRLVNIPGSVPSGAINVDCRLEKDCPHHPQSPQEGEPMVIGSCQLKIEERSRRPWVFVMGGGRKMISKTEEKEKERKDNWETRAREDHRNRTGDSISVGQIPCQAKRKKWEWKSREKSEKEEVGMEITREKRKGRSGNGNHERKAKGKKWEWKSREKSEREEVGMEITREKRKGRSGNGNHERKAKRKKWEWKSREKSEKEEVGMEITRVKRKGRSGNGNHERKAKRKKWEWKSREKSEKEGVGMEITREKRKGRSGNGNHERKGKRKKWEWKSREKSEKEEVGMEITREKRKGRSGNGNHERKAKRKKWEWKSREKSEKEEVGMGITREKRRGRSGNGNHEREAKRKKWEWKSRERSEEEEVGMEITREKRKGRSGNGNHERKAKRKKWEWKSRENSEKEEVGMEITREKRKGRSGNGNHERKGKKLDAFLYDATVLEYLVGQDDECKLLTVGSWYALTGYGVAFARKSKYLEMFNEQIMKYRENGDLERIARFWFTGACKPNKQQKSSSKPLALEQFMSTFLLLGCGILLALLLLGLEHVYFKYFRQYMAKSEKGTCCALISMSMGKSLSFPGAVFEAQDMIRNHKCQDPLCDTHLWKVKHELDMARLRIQHLENQLVSHGLRPPKKDRTVRSGMIDYMKPRDMTRSHVTTNEPIRGPLLAASSSSGRSRRWEVAELETVL
ncbi:uncharacterized protein [Palaemon carinicauda]|uniref:uncharacterized protein n=1 Tax=Palaemon carinicauda TaxID=392227 RepID=UPI0035B5DC19